MRAISNGFYIEQIDFNKVANWPGSKSKIYSKLPHCTAPIQYNVYIIKSGWNPHQL